MNCCLCDSVDQVTEAVAICRECGVALCREHMDQGLLAHRAARLVRTGCRHATVGTAHRPREIEELEELL
jgi:hypothetical protein